MSTQPSHYAFLLPPGWVRIDLRGDLVAQVEMVIARHAERAPRDAVARLRSFATPRLLEAVRDAAASGALDLVVPVPRDGLEAMSTFVVVPLKWPDGIDAVEGITAIAATDPSAQLAEVAGLVALRTESTTSRPDAAQPATLAVEAGIGDVPVVPSSRRVQYFIGDPERPDDWITVLFSIPLPDGEHAEQWAQAEAGVFDSIMSSVRFF